VSAPRIRPRRDEDLPACAEALFGVHEKDRYPVHWPADPQQWLTPDEMLGAWVAAAGPSILGHVVLTQAGAMIAEAVGIPAARLATVARMFVSVDARRGGLATDLLDRAAQAAADAGLRAVLEVDADATGAVAFYERAGWRQVGSGTSDWIGRDGLPAKVRFYMAPNS
jgi:GNAT superfamily N-acetyltransferase